jgi:hypothetical protein
MILSLLATFGTLGIAFGLLGLYLASTLLGGWEEAASDARHSAHMLLITGATLLIVTLARSG